MAIIYWPGPLPLGRAWGSRNCCLPALPSLAALCTLDFEPLDPSTLSGVARRWQESFCWLLPPNSRTISDQGDAGIDRSAMYILQAGLMILFARSSFAAGAGFSC